MLEHGDMKTGGQASRLLVLVGFMGAGKSSVGRELASQLGCCFLDLDDQIVRRERRSISSIFAHSGEAYFRRQESLSLEHLIRQTQRTAKESLVLALGGGAYTVERNRLALHRAGAMVVHLTAPASELRHRVGAGSGRPLAANPEEFQRLYEGRLAAYNQAGITIETTGCSVPQVARRIIEQLQQSTYVAMLPAERT